MWDFTPFDQLLAAKTQPFSDEKTLVISHEIIPQDLSSSDRVGIPWRLSLRLWRSLVDDETFGEPRELLCCQAQHLSQKTNHQISWYLA